jgi:prophage regulatory protein
MRLLRRKDVTAKTGLSRSAIYAGMKAGTFPQAVKINGHEGAAVGWVESEIDELIANRVAERDAKAA